MDDDFTRVVASSCLAVEPAVSSLPASPPPVLYVMDGGQADGDLTRVTVSSWKTVPHSPPTMRHYQ